MVIWMIKNKSALCEVIDALNLKPVPFEGSVVVTLDTADEVEQYVAVKQMPEDVRKQWLYNVAHDTPIILGYTERGRLKQSVS